MKPKVVSIFPLKRFKEGDVGVPAELDFHFAEAMEEDEVIAVCRGADFLLVPTIFPRITRRVLENIPSIRMIQSTGAGFDKVDVESAAEIGIPVANSTGENALNVAEYTIAVLVALQRHIVLADQEVKAGNYTAIRERFFKQGLGEVRGTKLGLVGLGAIGRKVASLAGLLGADLRYFDIQRQEGRVEDELKVRFLALESLLSSSDAISLHVPLTSKTKGLIGRQELRLMPAGSLLINTSRGEVVDQVALAEALESGHLGGAAIDTVSPEPPPKEHPLLNLSLEARERLLITPHIAGISKGSLQRILQEALDNIIRVASGEAPRNVVNGIFKARETKR